MSSILNDIKNTPFKIALQKAYVKLKGRLDDRKQRNLDISRPTRTSIKANPIQRSYVDIRKIDVSKISHESATFLADSYVGHRFNVLGSGWVHNSYESKANGLEGNLYKNNADVENYDVYGNWLRYVVCKKHYRGSKQIWGEINRITYDYLGIDWQKDVKSGFRWSAKDWYKDQLITSHGIPGVDVKVPFELSRLQHLPQMAILAMVLPERREELINEFFFQVIDFIAANPPRMGICWTSSMEVGIRASNMLLAYDLFNQIDSSGLLGAKFKEVFSNSIYEHGVHLLSNLDFKESVTNNHYLSNICGLLFISAYLDEYPNIDGWLSFSIQELISEIDKQILPDGGNFESSTSYQRLSGEMIIYSVALLNGLGKEKLKGISDYNYRDWKNKKKLLPPVDQEFSIKTGLHMPQDVMDKVGRMMSLTETLSKQNGEVPQIGDNDSGRFFMLSPCGTMLSNKDAKKKYLNLKDYKEEDAKLFWDENALHHGPFISAGSALFDEIDRDEDFPLEYSLVSGLANGKTIKFQKYSLDALFEECDMEGLDHKEETIIDNEIEKGESLKDGLEVLAYPLFGVCLLKSKRLHMAVSCGNHHGLQYWTHSHNDKLSFELNIDGKDLIIHPGTYVYTPLPEARNEFRSIKSHNTIIVDNEEQNTWVGGFDGVFRTEERTHCEVLHVGTDSITLSVEYGDIKHIRKIVIEDDKIRIEDSCNKSFEVNFNRFRIYSNGYGKRLF